MRAGNDGLHAKASESFGRRERRIEYQRSPKQPQRTLIKCTIVGLGLCYCAQCGRHCRAAQTVVER